MTQPEVAYFFHFQAIPFLGLIPGGLQPGRMIRIKGIIQNHGERLVMDGRSGGRVAKNNAL